MSFFSPLAEVRRMRPLLGTYVEVAACAADPPGVIAAAFDVIETAQRLWSFHDPGSELSALNRAPGKAVNLSSSSIRLLRLAIAICHASAGRFNCMVGGELVLRGSLPDHGPVAPIAIGRADDLELGCGWARLRRPVRVTLDGIAKGYAVDLAVRTMKKRGACHGWVNAGGDLRVFGDKPLFVHRRELDGSLAPLGWLKEAALASSRAGPDGDPSFASDIVGARDSSAVLSVLACRAWLADALTKVALATRHSERANRIASLGGCLVQPAT
jgi:FAD:protein FMN transferase